MITPEHILILSLQSQVLQGVNTLEIDLMHLNKSPAGACPQTNVMFDGLDLIKSFTAGGGEYMQYFNTAEWDRQVEKEVILSLSDEDYRHDSSVHGPTISSLELDRRLRGRRNRVFQGWKQWDKWMGAGSSALLFPQGIEQGIEIGSQQDAPVSKRRPTHLEPARNHFNTVTLPDLKDRASILKKTGVAPELWIRTISSTQAKKMFSMVPPLDRTCRAAELFWTAAGEPQLAEPWTRLRRSLNQFAQDWLAQFQFLKVSVDAKKRLPFTLRVLGVADKTQEYLDSKEYLAFEVTDVASALAAVRARRDRQWAEVFGSHFWAGAPKKGMACDEVAPSRMMVCGDLHESVTLFEAWLDLARRKGFSKAPGSGVLVLLGDWIDKGSGHGFASPADEISPQERTMRMMQALERAEEEFNIIKIRGNHEHFIARLLIGEIAPFDGMRKIFSGLNLLLPVGSESRFPMTERQQAWSGFFEADEAALARVKEAVMGLGYTAHGFDVAARFLRLWRSAVPQVVLHDSRHQIYLNHSPAPVWALGEVSKEASFAQHLLHIPKLKPGEDIDRHREAVRGVVDSAMPFRDEGVGQRCGGVESHVNGHGSGLEETLRTHEGIVRIFGHLMTTGPWYGFCGKKGQGILDIGLDAGAQRPMDEFLENGEVVALRQHFGMLGSIMLEQDISHEHDDVQWRATPVPVLKLVQCPRHENSSGWAVIQEPWRQVLTPGTAQDSVFVACDGLYQDRMEAESADAPDVSGEQPAMKTAGDATKCRLR